MQFNDQDRLVEQVIIDILRHEMGFAENSIWIRDQNRKIPNDTGFYCIVGMVDSKPYASQSRMETVGPDPDGKYQQVEVSRFQSRDNIQIDILSKDKVAVTRRWEIIAALKSIFAQQQQEKFQFKIASIPTSFVNSSNAEGGSQLNRYSIIVPCLVWYKKSKPLSPDDGSFYDDFHTRVDDENTIGTEKGLIEFEIKGNEIT